MIRSFCRWLSGWGSSRYEHPFGEPGRPRLQAYLLGAGSVVDPLPLPTRHASTFCADDLAALAADWRMVGDDIRRATNIACPVPHRFSKPSGLTANQAAVVAPYPDVGSRDGKRGTVGAL